MQLISVNAFAYDAILIFLKTVRFVTRTLFYIVYSITEGGFDIQTLYCYLILSIY